jgi:uncharacterized protein (DUF362 family)
MSHELSRRDFLKRTATVGAGLAIGSTGAVSRVFASDPLDFYRPPIDLAVTKGASPAKNCLAAVQALGGFSKFVHEGDRVVIKPNPVGSNPPERAINTHPDMVEAVIRECFTAGAKEVIAVSHDDRQSFEDNGTAAAVERAGGTVKLLNDHELYREVPVPRGRVLRRVEIATDVLDADVFINMPIAKHHAGSRVTFAMKNLMGVNWDRTFFHRTDLQRTIAELASAVRMDLVIMDANHVLMTNGPVGPGEVTTPGQVIAGVDPVAVDAFSLRHFDVEPERIDHIRIAHELGVGEIDLSKLTIKEFDA